MQNVSQKESAKTMKSIIPLANLKIDDRDESDEGEVPVTNQKDRVKAILRIICLLLVGFIVGCSASTPEEVFRAWAKANKNKDAEDVMYFSFQDQFKQRIDLKNEVQVAEFNRSRNSTKDYWTDMAGGDLLREYILGDRAWVTVRGDDRVGCFEFIKHEGKWKILDPNYSDLL